MASACVNNIGISPDNFLDRPWLTPRISFPPGDDLSKLPGPKTRSIQKPSDLTHHPDPDSSAGDFEFRLEDPVAMLPADELFSNGKLVPLQLTSVRPSTNKLASPETAKASMRTHVSATDPYLFSPKAPRCSSRWKELLGLKKLCQSTNAAKNEPQKTTSSNNANKSLKHFLHRNSKSSSSSSSSSSTSSSDASLSLPLLKDSDCESVSISSRLSLSSSSSGHEHEDLPRLSLESDKPSSNPISLHRNPNPAHPRMRLVKSRASSFDNNQRSLVDYQTGNRVGRSTIRRASAEAGGVGSRGVSVDSPRMNSSGKIVFQSLERSSSSPSSFNGGPKFKQRGMERSYSANVRVTPVLNVPVCSLRGSSKSVSVFGFGQFFSSPQKREVAGNGGNNKGHQHNNGRHRCDRN